MTFRTIIVGFGKVAAGNASDPVMSSAYRYPCHAAVLRDHAAFDWVAVVDPDAKAREAARDRWGVCAAYPSLDEVPSKESFDVAVLCMPPYGRRAVLEQLPGLKGAMVEKPLAITQAESKCFADACKARGLICQVNLWRRGDRRSNALADGGLERLNGHTQAAHALYGNGIRNNGVHIIDYIRMMLGEVTSISVLPGIEPEFAGPFEEDIQFPFILKVGEGLVVPVSALDFANYRQNCLDIWGTTGQLSFLFDSPAILHSGIRACTGLSNAKEVAREAPEPQEVSFGDAMMDLYDNFALALTGKAQPLSTLQNARRNETIIEHACSLVHSGGGVREPDFSGC